jgi:hypothetical protein
MPSSTAPTVWKVAGAALAAAGALTCLAKTALFLASAPNSGPVAIWSSVMGVLGSAGLAAAAGAWWRPGLAAVGMGAVGTLVILLDLAGLSGPPRLLGGVALLAGGALTAGQVASPAAGKEQAGGTKGLARVAVWVGLVAHAAVGVLLLPLGLVAPGWAVLLLYLVWGVLLVAALRARGERPWLVPATPLVALGVAVATLTLGASLLGWTP